MNTFGLTAATFGKLNPSISIANDNARAGATAYWPEMHETPDLAKLFRAETSRSGYFIHWSADRDGEAQEAFKRFRVRPKWMTRKPATKYLRLMFGGADILSAHVTDPAFSKLEAEGLTILKLYLD